MVLRLHPAGHRAGVQNWVPWRPGQPQISHEEHGVGNGTPSSIVTEYLEGERSQKRIALVGTAERAEGMGIHISPFRVIPKKNRVNKWRLILDSSLPDEHSVNDGVQKDLATYLSRRCNGRNLEKW